MVHLNRIYTKTGDGGETSLGDGSRVRKTDPRIAAYGGADELNAAIGVALTESLPEPLGERLRQIQNDLFDLGADLCVPIAEDESQGGQQRLRVTAQQAEKLEGWIDEANKPLDALKSFILPGGSAAAAHLHLARTICRRVEIAVVQLSAGQPINPQAAVYLNRLSDLLFVYARTCNDGGRADVLWAPGDGQ